MKENPSDRFLNCFKNMARSYNVKIINQNEYVLTYGGNVINLDESVALVKHGNDRKRA